MAKRLTSGLVVYAALIVLFSMTLTAPAASFPGQEKVRHADVLERAGRGEVQDLIVVFDEGFASEHAAGMRAQTGARHDTPDILREKAMIFRSTKQEALNVLTTDDAETIEDYDHLPVMFLRVKSQKALERLSAQPGVAGIYENQQYQHMLTQSLPLIGQPAVSGSGFRGSGTAVAVLDTGVDYTRAAFGTCSGGNVPGDCLALPSSHDGCRVACVHDFATDDGDLDDNGHGTNVSGIVAGVAPDTKVINLDVFKCTNNCVTVVACNGANLVACSNDLIDAINWVIANKAAYNISAINMSLGGDSSTTPCSGDVFATPIENARSAGILSAIASGNNGFTNRISSPACVPAAVSVGSVRDGGPGATPADAVSSFSNSASFLTILAPGQVITAAGVSMQGTSQATPHIAGSIAVLTSAYPIEGVDQIVNRMTSTGVPVTDTRGTIDITKPRIDLDSAISLTFTISGRVVSPKGLPVEGVTITMSGAGSGLTVTDANGDYIITDVSSGSYVLTPSRGAAIFAPASRSVTVSGTDVAGKNFTANVFDISGKVLTKSGKPVANVAMTLGGAASGVAVTDVKGKYAFRQLANEIYTVTPALTGYTFSSASKTITVNGADKTGKNFIAVTHAISGYVRNPSGVPMAGVTMTLGGDVAKAKVTDSSGFYRFGNLPDGSYTVTPDKPGKTFEPASRAVSITGANVPKQNFKRSP